MFFKQKPIAKKLRYNKQIRASEVLLIDGETKKVMPTEDALQLATSKSLDLVEVAPLSNPPVCKIMDYGNYLYGLKKKLKGAKKAKKTETKTIRLSMRTDTHDLEVKAKRARKFLGERHLIKVVLIFRGREVTHQDIAKEKMMEFYEMIEDICTVEQQAKRQGFQLMMILNPLK